MSITSDESRALSLRPVAWRGLSAHGLARVLPYVAVVLVALAIRVPFLPHESPDYLRFVSPWYDALAAHPWDALGTAFSDYTPPYLYVLIGATWLPLPKLLAIKLISIAFDVLLAAAAAALVQQVRPGAHRPLLAFALVLMAPSVVLNSSAWAQCDSLYAVPAILALVLLARGHFAWAMLALALSLAIKLQGVFLLPAFAVWTLKDWRRLPAWLLLPVPYLVAIIPPWLAGRPLHDLLLIYNAQADKYNQLTLLAPSAYAWVDARQGWGPYGVALGLTIVAVACLTLWRIPLRLTPRSVLLVALLFALLSPFVLPHMHDRYFYLADVLAVMYAVTRPTRWYVPVLIVTASTLSYWPFLFGFQVVHLGVLAAFNAAALAVVSYDVWMLSVEDGNVLTPQTLLSRTRARARGLDPRIIPFAATGLLCTAVYASLFTLFRGAVSPLPSHMLALTITVVLNFVINRWWTFRANKRALRPEAARYFLVYLMTLVISTASLKLALMALPDVPRLVETVVALGSGSFATIARFLLLRHFVFHHKPDVPVVVEAVAPESV